MLERHRPRLLERHPVLGAVVGHITDLEATASRAEGPAAHDATPS